MNRRHFLSLALVPLALGASACSSSSSSSSDSSSSMSWTTKPSKPLPTGVAEANHITIPKLGIDQSIRSLGLNANGKLEPPPHTVQWLNSTAIPGQNGNSILAGHVSWDGPDVFVKLDQLKVGDTFTIGYTDKHTTTYTVRRTESVDKQVLRTRQDVWGPSTKPHVLLVSCDDRSKMVGQHYTNNFVVWADPTGMSAAS